MAEHWLVRVELGGRSYMWSDTPVTPVDADGKPWPHLGGLPELRAPSDYDPFQQEPRVASVSVEVSWPPNDPVGELIADGHRFTDATAEVALWTDGTAYEDRTVVVAGHPTEPEYGAKHQPVAFTVEAAGWRATGSTHLATQRVSGVTWATGDTDGDNWYPVVIGRPAWQVTTLVALQTFEAGSPARVASRSGANAAKLVIAGHAVESTTVEITDGTAKESFSVTTEADYLGQLVSVVDITSASTISKTADSYSTIWSSGGAMVGPDGAISGAGDALAWALSKLDYPVDWSTVYAWRSWLNRFKVSGFIAEPTDPWDLITDAWLDNLLPVSVVVRDGKLSIIPWRYDARQVDALRHIEVGPGLTHPGRITYEVDRVRSRWEVSTALKTDGKPRAILIAEPAGLPHDGTLNSQSRTANRVLARARSLVGDVAEVQTSAWCGDESTAFISLYWQAIRGLVTRYVTVQDITGEFEELADGDVVTLTHAEAGIENALGLVSRDRLSPVAQNLRVILLPET
jgi:hypothetical protein